MLMLLKLVCLIFSIIDTESARILAVYPIPSISHQVVFRPLMHELARRGHEVVVITTDPAFPKGQTPGNLTEIDVHDVSYKLINQALTEKTVLNRFTYRTAKIVFELTGIIFKAQVESHEVQELIKDKSKKFDLIFVESLARITVSFHHLYSAPIIEFSSLGASYGAFNRTGVPTNPLVYPVPLHYRVNNLTIWEKISQLYTEYSIHRALYEVEQFENQITRKLFGPNIPDLSELRENIQMLFLNVHPVWDFNRPVPPNVIYLGGIHQNPSKELPQDLKTYLDSSKHGVIYVSFGSNVRPSLLPSDTLKIFTNVFSQLPYDILWKWDTDEFPQCPQNVRFSKWFPQSDLLKHHKVKLFITQGGLQSTDEALTAGVPLIGFPFLGDQWFNGEQYIKHKIGIQLDIEKVTENILKNAIEMIIINNKSYRENVVKLRNIMRDQPQSPLERAVWWTEHVLRHGGATHLRAAAAHMHWTEYYALDVVLLLLAMFLISLFGIVFLIRYIFVNFSCAKVKVN